MAESENSIEYPNAIVVQVDAHHRNCSQISPSVERSREYRDKKNDEIQAASDLYSVQRGYPTTAAERMRAYRARKKEEIPIENHRKRKKSDAERAREYRARKKGKTQSTVLEMPKTNAENCRAYYYRNKNRSVNNKCSPQTNAELCHAYRLQKMVGKSLENVVLSTVSNANSSSQAITTVPPLSSAECDNTSDINVRVGVENSPVLYYHRTTLRDIKSTKSEQSPRSQVRKNNQSIFSNRDIIVDQKRHSDNQDVIMDQKPQRDIPKEKRTEDDRQDKKTNVKPSIKSKLSSKPLLPVNFLKSCKKNLIEMTREELEEFCIVKIVESVVDRTNLKEMNLQLKSMACNIEYCKQRTNLLIKQNRILKVVLKSIEGEYKKVFEETEGPLKVTRSVGVQVLIEETPRRKKCMTPNKSHTQKQNNQEYTAPISVPAVINSNTKNKVPTLTPPLTTTIPTLTRPTTTTTLTPPTTSSIPTPMHPPKTQNNVRNDLKRIPSIIKPKKISYSKMKEGNSTTEDITDDEIPPKVIRNIAPVRLIPQKSQLTRPEIVNPANIPGVLLVPTRGSQNQVAQTFVLNQFSPPAQRLQEPTLLTKPSVSMPLTVARHPAPLPESEKPYQSPNCKVLPPPPVLELSKSNDGIVISWVIDGYKEEKYEEIASYQLYAYQETSSPPSTALWEKIGDVKALALPIACTLTQINAGYKYYFAVRAVDVKSRIGPFSLPSGILLLNKT